jgi:DNA repair exonuclease SbcCD nuclease subunit
MIRFLHTADWQIGTQFGQFDAEEAAHLAEARFETVRRIASEAATRRVDAVLVAGDVFDQQTVSDTVIRRLFGALAGFTGPWIMLPGNHDAALVESVWTRAQRLNCVPANVRVVRRSRNASLMTTPRIFLIRHRARPTISALGSHTAA